MPDFRVAKEVVDGHPCVKNKVIVTAEQAQTVEAICWNATDLKDFPIQIQTHEKEVTSVMHFRELQFQKPDAALFEPPEIGLVMTAILGSANAYLGLKAGMTIAATYPAAVKCR